MLSLDSDAAAEAPYQRIATVRVEPGEPLDVELLVAHECAQQEGHDALARK